jgi:hypothetical protein
MSCRLNTVQSFSLEERVKASVAGNACRPAAVMLLPVFNDPRFPDQRPTKGDEVV